MPKGILRNGSWEEPPSDSIFLDELQINHCICNSFLSLTPGILNWLDLYVAYILGVWEIAQGILMCIQSRRCLIYPLISSLSIKIAGTCRFSINAGSVKASLYKQIIFPDEIGIISTPFKINNYSHLQNISPAVHCSISHGLKFK